MDFPQDKVMPYRAEGDKRQQVEEMFDHIAPTYDSLNHTLSLGIDRHWRKKAIASLLPYRPQQMLDVATGTGDFALEAFKTLQPAHLTGIDISKGMLEVGRRKVSEAGLEDRISFEQDDCLHLSFADASFDAVTVAFGIRNFVGLDKGLAEIHRVLKPGGRLLIVELSTPRSFPMNVLYKAYTKTAMPLIGKLVSKDKTAYTYLPQSIAACPQGEAMTEIIRQAGFGEASYQKMTCGICTMYLAAK